MKFFLRSLSRITSTGMYLPEIDGLRFVAIVWVMLFHLAGYVIVKSYGGMNENLVLGPVVPILLRGDLGVQLFFVISGFILALPFAKTHLLGVSRITLGKYFGRRLTRLEPPYLIHLGALLTAVLVGRLVGQLPSQGGHAAQGIPELLAASATYSHTLIYGRLNQLNCVLWSLEVEVQFYILAPLLTTLFTIGNAALRRAVIIAVILTTSLPHSILEHEYWWSLTLLGNLRFFLVGFLLVDHYLIDWKSSPGSSTTWDGASLIGWLAVLSGCDFRLGHVAFPFAIYLAYAGVLRGKRLKALFRLPLIVTIGGMCYTIYMYHYIMIAVLGRTTLRFSHTGDLLADILVQIALMLPIILAACAVLFFLFERPFMVRDWPQRVWSVAVSAASALRNGCRLARQEASVRNRESR